MNFVNAGVYLAVVEIETNAGERAARLLGQLLLELETVRDSQHAVPVYQAAASFALWRGDVEDAQRAAARGWARVRETEDWALAAKMSATALEVEAVSAAWDGSTPDGGGTVTVTDAAAGAGERVHRCTVRADGSLAALSHV